MKKQAWKADEMEMDINFKAMRVAFVFSILALAAFCGYELIRCGELPLIPFLILDVQGALFFTVKLALTRKLARPEACDEESC